MAHELSETIERDGKFFNVSGITKKPLKPKFPFEKTSYDSLDEAVQAAEKRSQKTKVPKYRVETDQGAFLVELDKPTSSDEELMSLVQESLANAPKFSGSSQSQGQRFPIPEEFGVSPTEQKAIEFLGPMLGPVGGGLLGASVGGAVGGPIGVPIGEAIGSAGGEAISQVAGISDPSLAQIGLAGAMGPAARGVLGVGKGVLRGGGSLAMPQQFRVAGTEVAETMFRGPNSKRLFDVARQSGDVPTNQIAGVLDEALKSEKALSTPNRKAVKVLSNLKEKLSGVEVPGKTVQTGVVDAAGKPVTRSVPGQIRGGMERIGYDDLINEVQRLNNNAGKFFSSGDTVAGSKVSEVAKSILDEMDRISPAIKAANAAYRREQNIIKLADVISKGNPTGELRKLMRHDALFRDGFSKQEFRAMEDLVDRLGRFPGQALGLGRATVQALFEPVAEAFANPAGRALIKTAIKGPGTPAQLWSAAIQAARAFIVSQQQAPPQLQPQENRLNQQVPPFLTR